MMTDEEIQEAKRKRKEAFAKRKEYAERKMEMAGCQKVLNAEIFCEAHRVILDEKKSGIALAAALCLVTGRRSIEIVKQGRIERKGAYWLHFQGQAKKRGEGSGYWIPCVLERSDKVVDAWILCQKLLNAENLNGDEVNKKYSTSLAYQTKKLFELSPHACRAAYAAYCVKHFKPENMAEIAFVNQILGHETCDGVSSLAYLKFAIG